MYGVLFGSLADFLGGHLHAVGEYGAQAFSLHHLFRHGDDSLMITPGKLDAVGVLPGDNPVLVALDGEGDGTCRRR